MSGPDDVDDEPEPDESFRPPLPKDDRVWRHPSELDEQPSGLLRRVPKLFASLFSRQRS